MRTLAASTLVLAAIPIIIKILILLLRQPKIHQRLHKNQNKMNFNRNSHLVAEKIRHKLRQFDINSQSNLKIIILQTKKKKFPH